MSGSGRVRLELDDGLAVVTFASPPLNLYDEALARALPEIVGELERSRPRAVLFRAEGRVVSGGVDVSLFAAVESAAAAVRLLDELVDIARRVDALPCPTVFAAHALCLTWAFELALACDLIVAARRATFGLVERVIGLTPAMGGTQRLAERAGSGRARELVMTGRRYDAATLERWNVVNWVLADEGFDAAARGLARELAQGPTLAHAATKEVVRAYREGGVDLADERVGQIAGRLFDTEDLRDAVRSFLDHGPGHAQFRAR
ncbi:MAG: enoyl-CoA hydratase/isomerase family protein [Solirubrobacterales bacterium]|nr:enoyl-CoA hydratase/isomerase family protein [Solirubrobacterales bacterium]MBV9713970.1 enoyl-CoA hydratase/isomerase family protein [Solirubrobacterales bacterium]